MDNTKNPNEKLKIAPEVANDQIGENASEEFAQDYNNKSKPSQSQTKNKK